jgi:poly(A) polymerase
MLIVRTLRDAGHVAYFAGGCVRDELLGLTPKDYDVATDATPDIVQKLFRNTLAVGAAFGVVLVRVNRSQIEVATFRTDGKYTDGRRPASVQFTTAEEDARRRDFTINGMFLDPLADGGGVVIDYVGGREDLAARRLRAIGIADERFAEDHLRMLRAVRFAARFALTIDPATAAAIGWHAKHLARISPERIAEELRAILPPPTRVEAWQMLWTLGLMPVIFRTLPERPTAPLPGDQSLVAHLAVNEPISFPLALGASVLDYRRAGALDRAIAPLLDHDPAAISVRACRTLLKISNDESDNLAACLDLGHLFGDELPTVAGVKRFMAKTYSADAMAMLAAIGNVGDERVRARVGWLRDQFASLAGVDVAPQPLVTGDDLTAAGMRPGPAFKRILDRVYDAQLEGRITSKEEGLRMALSL